MVWLRNRGGYLLNVAFILFICIWDFFREFRYSRSRGENYQNTCLVAVSAWRAAGEIIMKYD